MHLDPTERRHRYLLHLQARWRRPSCRNSNRNRRNSPSLAAVGSSSIGRPISITFRDISSSTNRLVTSKRKSTTSVLIAHSHFFSFPSPVPCHILSTLSFFPGVFPYRSVSLDLKARASFTNLSPPISFYSFCV